MNLPPRQGDPVEEVAKDYLATLPDDDWVRDVRNRIPDSVLLQAWELFLVKRHRLTPIDVWGRYGHPRSGLSKARRTELWKDQEWRSWADKILSIRVELKPGGRATSRGEDAVFTVNLRWILDHGMPMVASIEIVPDWGLAFNQDIDLDAHMLACKIQLAQDRAKRGRLPKRPKTGEPPNLNFYKVLLGEYDALVRDAHPAPARELADRRGINYSTLKSYLKRGRAYLEEGRG